MLRICGLAAVLGALALAGGSRADEKDNAKAQKELEGAYLIIGIEAKGFKLTEEDVKKGSKGDEDRLIIIKGDQMIAKSKGKDDPATFKLDAGKKHITITSVTKDGKKEVNYGIYKLEKDVLTIIATEMGEEKDRPTEFKVDDKTLMLTLRKYAAKPDVKNDDKKDKKDEKKEDKKDGK
jgi:uncharacterized protein (TIGR03067 family)